MSSGPSGAGKDTLLLGARADLRTEEVFHMLAPAHCIAASTRRLFADSALTTTIAAAAAAATTATATATAMILAG